MPDLDNPSTNMESENKSLPNVDEKKKKKKKKKKSYKSLMKSYLKSNYTDEEIISKHFIHKLYQFST